MRFGLPVMAALLATAGFARAAPPPSATPPSPTPLLDVKRARLDNGLRVVLLVDHTSPTVAIDVTYGVGARNEERGRSGFAHVLQHMMLQGSRNVPRGDHSNLVLARGGQLGASATADHTSYYDVLPARELALGLWLESDRMKSLDVSQANFEGPLAAAKDEIRQSIENAAYAPASIRLMELVFLGYWPYEHPGAGTSRELDGAQVAWLRTFHDAYYAPNNAVVSIAGDFEEADALALVKRYFGDARTQPNIPRYQPPPVPEQTAPRSSVVEDAHADVAALFSGWLVPAGFEPDHYALELVALLLGDGESSRLRRTLVRERNVAIDLGASLNGHHGPDVFQVDVKLATGARIDQVMKLLDAQLADVGRAGPTDEEMRRLKNRVRSRILFALQSNLGRAGLLADLELHLLDASLVNGEIDKYLAVTKEDIKRVVAKYLTSARRSTVEVKPGEKR